MLILNRVYNVTSPVHSYILITVFLGLVSGLLLVHSVVPFSPFPLLTYLFCHSVI